MRPPPRPGWETQPFATVSLFGWKNYLFNCYLSQKYPWIYPWIHPWIYPWIPDSWYLVQGTFLPPNGSMSNITGWKLVDPTSGEIPRLFWIQKIRKSPKWGLKFQGRVILGKKRSLPGSLQTVVRSGEASPDGQSIKIQSRFLVKKWLFQKWITPKMPKSKASLKTPIWGCWTLGRGC